MDDNYKVDFLSRVISAFVPAVVTECARRSKDFPQLKTKESQMEYAEKLSGEIISECNFTVEYDEEGNTLINITSNTNDDLTHIQNMKVDLHELYNELFNKIRQEVDSKLEKLRDDIKTELRMEMNMEFNNIYEKMEKIKSNQSEPAHGALKDFGVDVIPKFSFDTSTSVTPIMNGFESIANKVTFDAPKINDNEAEQLLLNNPIFAKVNKSLERSKKGAAAYTVDEFIEAREGRFDNNSIDEFKNRMQNLQVEYDEEDSYEREQWDKLVQDRFNQDL